MLKCNEGDIAIIGDTTQLKAEFCTLVYALHNNSNFSRDNIIEMTELGLLSKEEIDNKLLELDR